MKWILILVLVGSAFAQTPVLFYSNVPTGMCSGGQNNKGHWVTITGRNFGTGPDASHYVKLVAVSGGAITVIDTYLASGWGYTDPQGNSKISFQLGTAGGCVADGDYDIQVVTPAGTSNALPIVYGGTVASPNTHFHMFSGGSFYFADNNNGSCNDSGAGSYSTPYCTIQKCVTSAVTGAGNTCYAMPGAKARTSYTVPGNCFGSFVAFCGVLATPDKNIAVLGYPTTNFANVADVGCDYINSGGDCPDAQAIGIRIQNAKYITISNFIVRSGGGLTYTSGQEALVIGCNGYTAHHIQASDLQISNLTDTWETPVSLCDATFLNINGLSFLKDCGATNKHEGGIYIGESTNHINLAYSLIDYGFTITDPTCHVGKQIEIHPTSVSGFIAPAPTFSNANLSATTGGSLSNGIYDVYVSYYGNNYGPNWNDVQNVEGTLSSVGKVTLSGANNAITVTSPTGYNYLNTSLGSLDDGSTILCNWSLSLRIYMCLESAGTCTPHYQGNTPYTNTATQGNITAPNYTQTATLSSSQTYPTYSIYNVTGCFAYSLYVHDNKIYNAPNYAFPMNLGNGNKGPIVFYNNDIANVGNGASFLGDAGEKLAGDVFEVVAWDGNALEMGQTKNLTVINNTFYNSGSLNTAVTSYPGIISDFIGATEPTFTATFQSNIFVQPQDGQPFLAGTYGNPNTVITGDHNLCFGNLTYPDCPAGWNTSGGQTSTPSFTANGTGVHDSSGTSGLIYTGFNTKPLVGSVAINNGTDTSASGVTRDILGTSRPQQSIYDIGKDEFIGSTAGVSVSGVVLKGVVIH